MLFTSKFIDFLVSNIRHCNFMPNFQLYCNSKETNYHLLTAFHLIHFINCFFDFQQFLFSKKKKYFFEIAFLAVNPNLHLFMTFSSYHTQQNLQMQIIQFYSCVSVDEYFLFLHYFFFLNQNNELTMENYQKVEFFSKHQK